MLLDVKSEFKNIMYKLIVNRCIQISFFKSYMVSRIYIKLLLVKQKNNQMSKIEDYKICSFQKVQRC